jgi:hypothetical protein
VSEKPTPKNVGAGKTQTKKCWCVSVSVARLGQTTATHFLVGDMHKYKVLTIYSISRLFIPSRLSAERGTQDWASCQALPPSQGPKHPQMIIFYIE